MIPNPHQQAHELIACGTHDLSDSQQAWLRTHLNECRSCRDYAQAAEQFVRSLRSVPVVADLRWFGRRKYECGCVPVSCCKGKNACGWCGCLVFWSACRSLSLRPSCGGVGSGLRHGHTSQVQFGKWAS